MGNCAGQEATQTSSNKEAENWKEGRVSVMKMSPKSNSCSGCGSSCVPCWCDQL